MRPQSGMGLGKNVYKLQNTDKLRFTFRLKPRQRRGPPQKSPEGEFAVDSGASMHMLSKKRFKLRRNGDSAKIQELHNGGNGQWRSPSKRGSTCFRSRSLSLGDGAKLDDTPAVLSLGKQKPHLTKQGKKIPCKKENFVRLVVPGLSSKISYQCILYIATAGLVKYISKSSNRAIWQWNTRKLARFTEHPKQK